MAIHRVQIDVADYQPLECGRIISAAADRRGRSDIIDIWFENDFMSTVGIYVFGTGNPTPWTWGTKFDFRFIDTVVTPSGLVWHVYVGPLQ